MSNTYYKISFSIHLIVSILCLLVKNIHGLQGLYKILTQNFIPLGPPGFILLDLNMSLQFYLMSFAFLKLSRLVQHQDSTKRKIIFIVMQISIWALSGAYIKLILI